MSPADRSKEPGPRIDLPIALRIQHTVSPAVTGINGDVLCVEVMDSDAQFSNCRRNINSLPPEMARVEVNTNRIAGQFTQLQECLGVIHAEAGVRLQRDFHTS